ncbi:hypothetical protein ACFWBR_06395 [Streptomyces sp. NPDC060006]|uniref:hypothetical protein n=1 Tax=unclassified Streptomyces TaxID=2593676 RepID=UPI0036A5BB7D
MSDSVDWTPDWVTKALEEEVVPLADDAKDELIHHLFDFMRVEFDHGHSAQTRYTPDGVRFEEWKLNTADGTELPRLRSINLEGALAFYVAGNGEVSNEGIEPWRRGISAALSRLGTRKKVPWEAVITQALPHQLMNGQRLESRTRAKNLSFQLLDGCISEDIPVPMTGVGVMVSKFAHWPIQVKGETSCYSWDPEGELLAMQRLRKITALLSLRWDTCWELRQGPVVEGTKWADIRGPLMGDSWRPVRKDNFLAEAGVPIAVPDWLDRAEKLLGEKRMLRDAVLMHHEGLALRRGHPSIALVCFTSVIETVKQINKKPERCTGCEYCEGCGSVISSRARFEDAMRSVLGDDPAALLGSAYGMQGRSGTVHASRLHGLEAQANNSGPMSVFLPDQPFVFTYGTVGMAQEASRKLLLLTLGIDSEEGAKSSPGNGADRPDDGKSLLS